LKERRYLVAYLLLAKFAGSFALTPKHILGFRIDAVTEESVGRLLEFIHDHNDESKPCWSSRPHLLEVCRAYGEDFSLEGFQSLAQAPTHFPFEETVRPVPITTDFLDRVRGSLPAQPWKPGLQRMLLQNLDCSQAALSTAIETLVENGEILRQRNGVLYDMDGAVVAFDAERVDPMTLQLLR
jgi:hypothetical protein